MSFAITRRSAVLGAAAAATAVAVPITLGQRPARATTPGLLGMITYKQGTTVYIADPNGANPRVLVSNVGDGSGCWAPDGSRFVYAGSGGIRSIRANGTGDMPVVGPAGMDQPTYAIFGSYVIYTSYSKLSITGAGGNWGGGVALFVVADDGKFDSNAAVSEQDGMIIYQHATDGVLEGSQINRVDSYNAVSKIIDNGWAPDFSPDGSRIAFVRTVGTTHHIWTAAADGSDQQQLTTDAINGTNNTGPKWSPDGASIIFASVGAPTSPTLTIKVINVTTKALTHLASGTAPTWQPVVGNYVNRVWGQNAIGTAIATSRYNWSDKGVEDGRGKAQCVVLSRADAFYDALAGSALAIGKIGPLMITARDALNPAVEAEIGRILAPGGTVYLLGGTAALAAGVESRLDTLGYNTIRLWGNTAIETAIAIANEITKASDGTIEPPTAVIITTMLEYYDALAAGAAAGNNPGTVIVLTIGSTMPAGTAAYLDKLNPDVVDMIGVGGPGVDALISGYQSNLMPHWPDQISYWPVEGATAVETAVEVAEFFFSAPYTAALATTAGWYDALTGGAMIGSNGGPLLLTGPTSLHASSYGYLSRNCSSILWGVLLGGSSALSDNLVGATGNAIALPSAWGYFQYTDTYQPQPISTLRSGTTTDRAPKSSTTSSGKKTEIPGLKRKATTISK